MVVEVTGHVAGPYAGSLLGDLGCDVIKVEWPGEGDTHRGRNIKYGGSPVRNPEGSVESPLRGHLGSSGGVS
jgi:formyl-CoA transferase